MSIPTILCVDDERNVLLTLRTQLSRHFPDHAIEIAESGDEALALVEDLSSEGVDVPVVIADQIMPGMPGDQLLIALHTRYPQMMKIMLTGQASAEHVGNVVNQGNLYRFIAKPWNEDDLTLTINEALRRYQQEQQLAQHQAALEQANQELAALNNTLEQQVQERTRQLQAALDFNQQIIAHAQEGIIVWDCDLRYRVWNRFMERLSGLSTENVLGQYCLEVFPFLEENGIFHLLHRALAGETVVAPDVFFSVPETGRTGWSFECFVPLRNEQGAITGVLGTVHDVTDRKQAEVEQQQLLHQLSDLKFAVDQAAIVITTDATGRITEVNDLFCQISQYSRAELLGTTPHLTNSGYHSPAFFQGLWETISSGQIWKGEIKNRAKDGSEYWLDTVIVPFLGDRGVPFQYMALQVDITARKQTELALRESEQRYIALSETAPVGIFRSDAAGNTIYVNPRWSEITELSFEAGLGSAWVQCIHPDWREQVFRAWQQFTQNHIPYAVEACLQMPDNRLKWVYCQAKPERNTEGEVIGYVGTLVDITNLKQAEAQASANLLEAMQWQTRYEAAGRASRQLLYDYDVKTNRIVRMGSPESLGYSGVELGDSGLEAWQELIHPDDRPGFEAAVARALVEHQSVQLLEYRVRRKDGHYIWVQDNNTIVLDERGHLTNVIGYITNINERKQAEQALRESEQQNRAILSALPDIMTVINAEGYYLSFSYNQFMGEVLPIAAAELIGNNVNHILPPMQAERCLNAIQRALSTGAIQVYEQQLQFGDRLQYEEVRLVPYQEDKVLCLVRNVSDRKHLEAQLQQREAFLQNIYNTVEMGIYVIDVMEDGDFLYVDNNAMGDRMAGAEPGFLRGKRFSEWAQDALTPEAYQSVRACYQRCVATGEAVEFEEKTIFNGQESWWLARVAPILNEQGLVTRLIVTSFSITDRKRAEIALYESETRLRRLTENVPGLVYRYVKHPDGTHAFPYISPRSRDVFGMEPEAIQDSADSLFAIFHPDDLPAIQAAIGASIETLDPFFQEFRFVRPDGEVRWLQARTSPPYYGTTGEVIWDGVAIDVTGGKQSEAALRESQQFIQQIADSSPNVIYIYDLVEQRNLYVNREVYEFLGYTHAEIMARVDQSLSNLMHPDDLEPAMQHFAQLAALPDGAVAEFEYRMQHKAGEWRWFSSRDTVFKRDGEGNVVQILGNAQDVTLRKRAEAALRETETRLQRLAENLPGVVYRYQQRVDGSGFFPYISPRCDEIYGISAERIMQDGSALSALFHPEDASMLQDSLMASLQSTTRSLDFEHRITTPTGQVKWLQVAISHPEHQPNGDIIWDGVVLDVTQRKLAEAARQEGERFLSMALTASKAGVWEWDLQTDRAYWSAENYRLMGYEPDSVDVTRDIWLRAVHPEDREPADAYFNRTIAEGGEINVEYRVVLPNGTVRWVNDIGRIVQNDQGIPISMSGIQVDITDRKQAEIQLQERETQLTAIASNIPGGVFRVIRGADGRYFNGFASDGYRSLCGVDPQQLQDDPDAFIRMIHPDDQETHFTRWEAALRGESDSFRGEARYILPTGEVKWIATSAQLTRLANGDVVVDGIDIDITYRKQIELEISRSHDLREAIFNESADALFLVDAHTLLTLDCNNRAIHLFEATSKDDLINIEGTTLQRQPFTAAELEHIAHIIDTQACWSQELEYVTLQGKAFWGNIAAKQITVAGRKMNLVRVTDISDRKQAELALRESERRYAALAETAPVGIFRSDRTGRMVYSNDRWSEITGMSLAEGERDGWMSCVHPDWRDRFLRDWQDATQRESRQAIETCLQMQDGNLKWVYCLAQPEKDTTGNIAGYVGTLTDITNQKQLELTLRQSEAELRSLFTAMDDVVIVVDREGTYLKILQTNSSRLYVPPEQLIGHNLREFFSPEQINLFLETIHTTLEVQETQECEYRLLIDNTECWFNAKCSPLTEETILWVARDVSDRKQLEAELRQREAFLNSIYTGAEVAISVVDVEADNTVRFVDFNPACAKLSGVDPAFLQGKTVTALSPFTSAVELTKTQAYYEQCIATGEIIQYEIALTVAGQEQWWLTRHSPLKDETGRVYRIIGTSIPITERRQAELQLQHITEELDRFFTVSLDLLCIASMDGYFLRLNPSWEKALGYSLEELKRSPFLDFVHPDDRASTLEAAAQLAQNYEVSDFVNRYRHRDGSYRWIEWRSMPVGNLIYAAARDITVRKQAEAQLATQNVLLARIAQGEPLTDTLNALIQQVEHHLPHSLCSVLLLDAEGRLRHGAAPSLPEGYIEAVDGVFIGEGVGSCGTAAVRNETVIVSDVMTDPLWENFREIAVSYDLQACWSTPIVASSGQVLGTFGVYYREVRSPHPSELDIIAQMANIAGIAIARQQAETQIRQGEEQLRLTLDFTGIGSWSWHPTTGEYQWNGKMEELLELPPSLENLYQAWRDRIHPDDVDRIDASIQHALATQTAFTEEYRYCLNDGRIVWRWVKGQGIYTPTGEIERVLGVVQDIGDRKQAELALQRSEEQLRLALEFGQIGIWDWDFTAGTIAWSDLVYQQLGYQPSEIDSTYESWVHAIHPEDRERVERANAIAYAEKQDFLMEYRVVQPDGSQCWIMDRGRGVYNAEGHPIRAIGIMMDITDRKVAELELQRREEQLQTIATNIPGYLYRCVVQADGTLVVPYMSAGVEHIYGLSPETAIAHPEAILSLMHPEDRARVEAVLTSEVQTPLADTLEIRVTDTTGHLKWITASFQAHRLENGDTVLDGVVLDITERKQLELERQLAQDALRDSEAQYRRIVETANEGIWIIDPANNTSFVNPKMAAMLGYSVDDMLGKPLFEFMDEAGRAIADQNLERRRRGLAEQHDFKFQHKNGADVWVMISTNPIQDDAGQYIGALAMITDISDRKQAELALRTAQERYSRATRAARVGVWEWNLKTNEFYLDPNIKAVLGYTDAEIANDLEQWVTFVYPDDRDAVMAAAQDYLAGKTAEYVFEHRMMHKNGSLVWILVRGQLLRDEQGNAERLIGTDTDITDRKQAELSLQRTNQLLSAISQAQTRFITKADPGILFDNLLETLLQLTNSEYGFIGEILYTATGEAYVDESYMKMRGRPYMKTKAITNIAWNEETRQLYDANAPTGMEFHNMKTLFGQVILTGQPVISNDPKSDPRRGGLPADHPPLNAFLGVPFYRGEHLVGMVGLANRPTGYDEAVIAELQPFLTTCASTIEAYRSDAQRRQAELALHQLNEELEQRVQQRTHDLQQAYVQLRDSEERFRQLAENVGEVFWLTDLEFNLLYISPAFESIWGRHPSYLLEPGHHFLDTVYPEDRDIVRERMTLRARGDYDIEYRILRPNGEIRWIRDRAFLIEDETGQVYRIGGIAEDISDRKQVEMALRESQQFTQHITDSSPNIIYIYDLEHQRNLYTNRELTPSLGYTSEQVKAMGSQFLATLVHPDDFAGMAIVFEHIRGLSDQGIIELEYRMRHADGSWRWLYDRIAVFKRDAAGNVTQYIGVVQDITDRKQAEEALQESEERFRQLAETVDAVFWLTDTAVSPQILYVSPAFKRVWQRSAEEVFSSHEAFLATIHPDDQENTANSMALRFQGEAACEYRIFRPDGEIRWIRDRAFPIYNEAGDVYRIAGVAEDITDRKRAEIAVQQSEQDLRTIFNNVYDAIFIHDTNGKILDVNDRALELNRTTRDQLLASGIADLSPPDAPLEQLPAIFEQVQSGETVRFEWPCQRLGDRSTFASEVAIRMVTLGSRSVYIAAVRDITDRKQAELALRESEDRFRTLFEATPNPIQGYDKERRVIFWNRASEQLYGYAREEALGKRVEELIIPPEMWAGVLPIVNNWIAGHGYPLPNGELQLRNKQGEKIDVYSSHVMLSNLNGDREMYCIDVDLRDRKLAEMQLREQELFLRSIYEGASQPIFVSDVLPDNTIQALAWNPAAARVVGKSSLEIAGKSVHEILDPDSATQVLHSYAQCIATKQPYTTEERLQFNGQIRWMLTTYNPLIDSNGRVYRIIGTVFDISDRKQAEEALLEAQQFAQSIADKTPAALYIYDLVNYRNLYSNRSIVELLGYSPAEIQAMGSNLLSYLLHPEDVEKVAQHQQALLLAADGEDLEIEYRMRQANGSWRWFFSRDSVFKRDETGTVTQYIGAAQDITDRKLLEYELRQINAELEHRVEERTIDLQHAMEAAELANRAKSTFLANMSHELRTPLNAILGFAQLMNRDRTLEDSKRQQLSIINRSGKHLLNLINDILEMSKIEAGRSTFAPAHFDLYIMLTTLREMFHLRAAEKGLRLTIDRASTVPQHVETDENKLRQVLVNLLGNAIKFTRRGSVTLQVSVETESGVVSAPPHPQAIILRFAVEDTGPGIDPSEINSLFEPFIQSKKHPSQEGTGLGLSISRQFVQLLGGDLTVTSTLEVGSTFTFAIPVQLSTRSAPPALPLPRHILGLDNPQSTYRILVVEDNDNNRQLLVQLLESVGYDVQAATNGQEAIALWQCWHPQFIWMDMRMPVLDGYAATQQIRAIESQHHRDWEANPQRATTPPVPTIIVALTASAFEEERAKVLGVGCNDFVRKPFQENELLEKMSSYLNIQYRYDDDDEPTADPEDQLATEEAIAALRALPSTQLDQLHQATVQLDGDRIASLIQQIAPNAPQLADLLTEKLENFDLQQILELLQRALS